MNVYILVSPAKTRKRLRRGGGPRPDTPAHSSSSSQSPLWNPSSPSSLHPPRGRALQRFSDVVSCSNCVGKAGEGEGEGRAAPMERCEGKKNPIKSGAAAFRKYKRLWGLADTTNIWREIENVVRMEIYNICV